MQTVDHREERPSNYIISIGPTILKTRDDDPILLIQYWPTVGPHLRRWPNNRPILDQQTVLAMGTLNCFLGHATRYVLF